MKSPTTLLSVNFLYKNCLIFCTKNVFLYIKIERYVN